MLKLNWSDFAKGLVLFVITAVVTSLAQYLNAPGFDYATFNWGLELQVALTAMISYLAKNLMTADNGKVFGKIG